LRDVKVQVALVDVFDELLKGMTILCESTIFATRFEKRVWNLPEVTKDIYTAAVGA
jgi:hypothetical protein